MPETSLTVPPSVLLGDILLPPCTVASSFLISLFPIPLKKLEPLISLEFCLRKIWFSQGMIRGGFAEAREGFLLTVNVTFPFDVNLQSPFTKTVVSLPPLTYFEDVQRFVQFQAIFQHSGALTLIKDFVKKAVSSTSLLDPDWVVLIMYDTDGGKLAFCRRGDKQWTDLESDHVDDIVFCSGVFFAMDRNGRIYQCELSPNNPKAIPLCSASPFLYDPCKKYFAESDYDKLWVVLQKLDVSDDYDFTMYFEIYELDSETKEWTIVRSLRGKALFLSPQGTCKAVLAGETGSRGFIKDNSIYFIDGSPRLGPLNLSVFEWESKEIKKFSQSGFCNCMFWVTPADVLQRSKTDAS